MKFNTEKLLLIKCDENCVNSEDKLRLNCIQNVSYTARNETKYLIEHHLIYFSTLSNL